MRLINISFAVAILFVSTLNARLASDSIETQTETDTSFIMKKSPWGAVLRSAILPGWGQYYNESYWKIPVVWGVAGWFLYNNYINNKDYWDNAELYSTTKKEEYRRLREFYRDQRDLFTIYLGLTYLLNMVDAYVDAHLFDFTVTPPTTSAPAKIILGFRF